MNLISTILEFEDLFDEEPKPISFYLAGICKEYLIEYSIRNISLSTIIRESKDIFFAFFIKDDTSTEIFENLANKINHYINNKKIPNPTILNIRSSLFFYEYVQKIDGTTPFYVNNFEVRLNFLKAYC